MRTETHLPPLDDEKSILRVNSPKSRRDNGRSPTNDDSSYESSTESTDEPNQPMNFQHSNDYSHDDYFDSLHKTLIPKMGQPKLLTKDETSRFRMSTRQTLFTDMLLNGFNKSYMEIYNLERQFQEENKAQGVNTAVMLPDQELKLLCDTLQAVEKYERSKSSSHSYTTLKNLAERFESAPFVNQYLMKRCFQVAVQVGDSDQNRILADAHKLVGMNFFRLEKYDQAYDHLNRYMEIVDQSDWKNVPGQFNFYIDACNELRLFYVRLGELTSNPEEALEHFQMAHSYAALCDNKQQIKQVSHKLGKGRKHCSFICLKK